MTTLLQLENSICDIQGIEKGSDLYLTEDHERIVAAIEDHYNSFIEVYGSQLFKEERGFQLLGLGDTNRPNYMQVPDGYKSVSRVHYRRGIDSRMQEAYWVEPQQFYHHHIMQYPVAASNTTTVTDTANNLVYQVFNNREPSQYTSFDDKTIVFDSYDVTYDATLQQSKSSAYGIYVPPFSAVKTFVLPFDGVQLQYYLAEAREYVLATVFKATNQGVTAMKRKLGSRMSGIENLLEEGRKSGQTLGEERSSIHTTERSGFLGQYYR